jgi:hypothetical protein
MLDIIEAAMLAKLKGTSAITSLLSGATAVFNTQSPANSARPYVIFQYMAGGDTNDTPRRALDVRYMVKGVANGGASASAIAAAIEAALHDQLLTLASPWACYRMQHITPFTSIENIDQTQIYHVGGIYRIRAAY